jgi:hypothetical protein
MINFLKMEKSEANQTNDSLGSYYASRRAPAIVNYNGSDIQIGRVFAEYKDRLLVIDGENKKEHEYLIPKAKVDRFGDNQVYFNVTENSLKEFEI